MACLFPVLQVISQPSDDDHRFEMASTQDAYIKTSALRFFRPVYTAEDGFAKGFRLQALS